MNRRRMRARTRLYVAPERDSRGGGAGRGGGFGSFREALAGHSCMIDVAAASLDLATCNPEAATCRVLKGGGSVCLDSSHRFFSDARTHRCLVVSRL